MKQNRVGHGPEKNECVLKQIRSVLIIGYMLPKVVKPKDAPKTLPWVYTAIANAKSLFRDMYHDINEVFLQKYLNEFCYKFNRRYYNR